jgi:hypothetical protein
MFFHVRAFLATALIAAGFGAAYLTVLAEKPNPAKLAHCISSNGDGCIALNR